MQALLAAKIQSQKALHKPVLLRGLVAPALPAGPGDAAGEQLEFREVGVGGLDQLVSAVRFLGVAAAVGFDHRVGPLLWFGSLDLASGCEQQEFVSVACPNAE